ncbi:MAG: MotA/TolQ/ExbB proton channel family protein [Planctomycetota bacterium]
MNVFPDSPILPGLNGPVLATAPATSGAGVSAEGVEAVGYRLAELFMFSPVINGCIAALSVIALGLFLWLLLTINARAMAPRDFLDEVTRLVVRGEHEKAADLCRRARGVWVGPIVQRCVENAGQGHSVVLEMVQSEGRRAADVVWNRVSYLSDISNVAPMLGLLGTVIGMITAFFGLERETGSINAAVLSRGVGQAMTTTMFGLFVAIGSLVMYSIIKSRATRTLAEAERAVNTIADHLQRDESPDDRR